MLMSWRKMIWAAVVMSWRARLPTLTGELMFPQVICGDWATALVEWSPPGESSLSVRTI